MEERINGIQAKCPGHSPFTYTYVASIVDTLQAINQNAFVVYGWLIIVAAPLNIAANMFSAAVLITKELRNPFNVMLSIMCLECVIPLLTKAIAEYTDLSGGRVCNAVTQTYKKAMIDLIVFNAWAPFRSAYTWMTAFLTMMRYRALRSKGKWEATYSLAALASFLAAFVAATAGIPTYMINIIDYVPAYMLCRNPAWKDNGVLLPVNAWSQKMYSNNCTLFYTNQVITGVFHNALPSLILFALTIILAIELGNVRKGHNAVAARSTKKTDDAAKAARMLGVVAILTLLSELPQVIVWMMVQTVATSCNLIIYLVMSKAFRQKVVKIFCGWMQTKTTSPQVSIISVSTGVKAHK